MLESFYFDFKIEPAMCKLWTDKAAPIEIIEWIEKPFNL